MKKHSIFGYHYSDLFGTFLMIIPFIISMQKYDVKQRVIPFIPWWTRVTTTEVMSPGLITGFLAISFYFALIIRYGFFRRNNFFEIIISFVKLFLNCWVIASLISCVLTTKASVKLSAFEISNSEVLLFTVLLSWIGMKSIAGYSWIIFILMGFSHLQQVDAAMGKMGFVFIITTAAAVLFQVQNYSDISSFLDDFRTTTGARMRGDISAAANDASYRIKKGLERF